MTERELSDIILDHLKGYDLDFEPMFPAVLVRVLPKDQMRGSLFLPDVGQNKPVYEGIVLKTWKPKVLETKSGHKITLKSECAVGDIVLFPHFSGMPVPRLPSGGVHEYRMVPELHGRNSKWVIGNDSSTILGKVKLSKHTPKEVLSGLLGKYLDERERRMLESEIERDLDVVHRVSGSSTVSGA